jgi:hypothetical protein
MPGISLFALIPGMAKTDFFRDMKVNPPCAERNKGMLCVSDALALPAPFVGQSVTQLARLPPQQTNGKLLSTPVGKWTESTIEKVPPAQICTQGILSSKGGYRSCYARRTPCRSRNCTNKG